MPELIKTLARIELFEGNNMRKTPFVSGYRPLFDFDGEKTKVSGKINLFDTNTFAPGESGVVEITFIKGIIGDGHFKKGEVFSFGEGKHALGKGEITQVIA